MHDLEVWCMVFDASRSDGDHFVEVDNEWFDAEQDAMDWVAQNGYDDPDYEVVIEDAFGTRRRIE